MRKDRKGKMKKERMIMLASSALVMGALTLTGVYIKGQSDEQADDGYSVDFGELENNVDDKAREIAQKKQEDILKGMEDLAEGNVSDDALDYDPLAAGSSVIEIPGLTDTDPLEKEIQVEGILEQEELDLPLEMDMIEDTVPFAEEGEVIEKEQPPVAETAGKQLAFTESQGLTRPVSGEAVLHYSMDSSIYFATLDQYKYNPAVMLSAVEGDMVTVCADAQVLSIYDDAQLGRVVVLDLGNGYQATYGQLGDIRVAVGAYVNRGQELGTVAAPSKYYSVEGVNLYFKLTKDGTPVNPEQLFQ